MSGFDIGGLLAEAVTATFTKDGKTLEVTYRPDQITPAAIRKVIAVERGQSLDSLDRAEQGTGVMTELLQLAVVDWNLTKNGVKIEPTAENIDNLPLDAQKNVWRIIVEDTASRRGKESSTSSASTKPRNRTTPTTGSRPRKSSSGRQQPTSGE